MANLLIDLRDQDRAVSRLYSEGRGGHLTPTHRFSVSFLELLTDGGTMSAMSERQEEQLVKQDFCTAHRGAVLCFIPDASTRSPYGVISSTVCVMSIYPFLLHPPATAVVQ